MKYCFIYIGFVARDLLQLIYRLQNLGTFGLSPVIRVNNLVSNSFAPCCNFGSGPMRVCLHRYVLAQAYTSHMRTQVPKHTYEHIFLHTRLYAATQRTPFQSVLIYSVSRYALLVSL